MTHALAMHTSFPLDYNIHYEVLNTSSEVLYLGLYTINIYPRMHFNMPQIVAFFKRMNHNSFRKLATAS